jgi:serine/threonine protein phosphatase 1
VIWKKRSQSKLRRRPSVPNGLRIYAIGDIHGRADLLSQVFAQIDSDRGAFSSERSIHVFIGDYVDRGPASREVLDLLLERGRIYPAAFLKGNHETYFLEFFKNPALFSDWRLYGGVDTLLSYGVAPSASSSEMHDYPSLAANFERAVPDIHRKFLEQLRPSFACGDYFFAHAGVRPGIALAEQREDDLLWIRDDFLLYEEAFEKFIVHGHTPVMEPDIRSNRINIDTGAFATGRLTCAVLERDVIRLL